MLFLIGYNAKMLPSIDILQENFASLDDWEVRYGYVLDLGKKLAPLPDSDKVEANSVRGCTAKVWLVATDAGPGRVAFRADSDAHLVRGLIAILSVVYNGQTHAHVRDFNIEKYFESLGLAEHLTPNRRNGFFAMVEKIKSLTAKVVS